MATAVSINHERHASSLIVALEFYPQMASKMIHKCSPNTVLMMIQNEPNNKFMRSLNNSETKLIPTLSTDGFNKLNISLLYKLIRHFNLVPEPSGKWGNIPLPTNIDQGDDMERMRFNRNDLVLRKGGLSEEEGDNFFKESIEIACRVDNFIGDSTSSFETGIRNVHDIAQEKYRQTLDKCVELQRINRVDLYYGDDIAVKLGHQDLPATDSTRCTMYIRDPDMDVPTIIEQLEQARKRLNEGSYDVILLDAKSGSLVLHDSSPSGTPEKKKLVGDKIDPDQLKLIKEDEGNKILWNEAKEFTKEGAQVAIKKEEQEVRTATIESLKKKLEEEGLHFRGSIPDDGNSFFKACSDQLQLLEISGHTHTELRQMVIPNFQFYTENEIKSANFTRDTWKIYIDKVAEDNENVEDIVVEAMAKLLRRQIIIYSLNPTKEISTTIINEDANETPLLLAKDKLYYQSLERRHGTPSRLQESNTSKREEKERIDMERKINEERIYKEMIEKDRDIERERMRVDKSSSGGGDKPIGMAEATTSRHESNYIKITMLVLKICPRAVQVQFDKEFNPVHLQRTLNRNIGLLTNLKMKKRITQPQWNLLFPRTGEPSSKDFDMILMICLLRNLMPIGIMDRLPSATDTSVGADLSRIKYYRNIIANCDSTMFDDDTVFESYWNDVTPAILRLGGNSFKAECDDWYGKNFDAGQKELEQKKRTELAEMKKKFIELEQEQSNPVPKNIREREEKEKIDMERKINEERKYKETIEKSEKDRDIETEERERMRVDISSSGAMRKEDSNMFYRLLRPDESYEDGLRAKNPNSTRSVFDHVISGSGEQQSKYISTCGSWEAVHSFRNNSDNPGLIVKIKEDTLPLGFEIIDLRRQENRNNYIKDYMDTDSIEQFNNLANTFQEVLLVGYVPGECIKLCDD